ncbi:MAG: endonuclease domain-containing protein [Nonlabens sp.]|uniref:endonuclease domain-containing protein n=1 Tax=Nonlabens sp. TaxID=1888209 RepID=UPI003EF63D9E
MNRRKPIHNLRNLQRNRKGLRKSLTPAEAFLWNELKSQKFHGIKFRRQHSIKYYIVDFYCAQHKLIIELDGDYHDETEQQNKDELRDKELSEMDLTVLRYENNYVFEELEHVLGDIKKHCKLE